MANPWLHTKLSDGREAYIAANVVIAVTAVSNVPNESVLILERGVDFIVAMPLAEVVEQLDKIEADLEHDAAKKEYR